MPTDTVALNRRIAFLKQSPLFAGLNEAALEVITGDFTPRKYAAGEIIFHQGAPAQELYMVHQGRVCIYKTSPAGGQTLIQLFTQSDILGEFGVIDDQDRSATARAIDPCILLSLSRARFRQRVEEFPQLAVGMCNLLTRKVRWTAEYAETIAQYDTAGRFLHLILAYNTPPWQREVAPGRYEIDLGLSQAELASMVGAQREWLNRRLSDWRRRGLLAYKAGKIVIFDLDGVKAERNSRLTNNTTDLDW